MTVHIHCVGDCVWKHFRVCLRWFPDLAKEGRLTLNVGALSLGWGPRLHNKWKARPAPTLVLSASSA